MATYRKRNGRWQVQVRRTGQRSLSRTFTAKADALRWGRAQEHAIEVGDLPSMQDKRLALGDLLDRYENEVIPLKRTDSSERYMLRVIRRHPMTKKTLSTLSVEDVADYRDQRLRIAKPSTVMRHLRLLRHALKVARNEWGWRTPCFDETKLRLPQVLVRSNARVSPESFSRLLAAARDQLNPYFAIALELALATAMRRGELLSLRWDDVDLDKNLVHVRMSKNGHPRTVPLSHHAVSILRAMKVEHEFVLPISPNCIKLGFARARRRADISFRFHDLRHEAISRLFEKGLTVPEVQLVSGHRTLSQVSRYSHPDVARVAQTLSKSSA